MTRKIFISPSSSSLCMFFVLDLMKRSAPARIVTLSSVNHKKGQVDFSHFHGENLTYYMDYVYNHTKLHNIICTNELARRLQGTGMLKLRLLLLSLTSTANAWSFLLNKELFYVQNVRIFCLYPSGILLKTKKQSLFMHLQFSSV